MPVPLQGLPRTLRTVRWLRPRQVAHQIARRLRGPARTPESTTGPGIDGVTIAPGWQPSSPEGQVDEHGAVTLLGWPPHDPVRDGWGSDDRDPLWHYTLHYHGWLSALSLDDALQTMLAWSEEHPAGVGWEPYPTSLRLLHWLGLLHARGEALTARARERVTESMAAQLRHLARHPEWHIDGNHLWTNLAALVACGAGLRGELPRALLERFAQPLQEVVAEQLAPDGVHGERTPTYHCVLAEQLAIVIAVARGGAPALAAALQPRLDAMLDVLPAMTHPDGDVALWGDSQLEAVVSPARLAARFGRTLPPGNASAPDSGLFRRTFGPWSVLWNAGFVGLPHQPGHVHGDALALELSLDATRVVVDAGVGTYVPGPDRAYARSTAAHNTATVGHGAPNQHELWASHRIARRAQPRIEEASAERLSGWVRGVFSPATHHRAVTANGAEVIVDDHVDEGAPACVRWFVPGMARVQTRGTEVHVAVPDAPAFTIALSEGAVPIVRQAPGWRSIGRLRRRIGIAVRVPPGGLRTRFRFA